LIHHHRTLRLRWKPASEKALKVIELYARPDNPLFVPEIGSGEEYAIAGPMMKELAKWAFEGKIKSVVEGEDHAAQTIDLGSWQVIVRFGAARRNQVKTNVSPISKAMVVQLGENEFLLIGTLCHFTFKPMGANAGKAWQYLKVGEGRYENGIFKLLRILNGDETDWGGPHLGAVLVVLHVTLTTR